MTTARWALGLAALLSCGRASEPVASNTVSGSISGAKFGTISAALATPGPSAMLPVIIYLSEAPLTCDAISSVNWDKTLGSEKLLEIGLHGMGVGTYGIPTEGYAAYLLGELNPNADSGNVTVSEADPNARVVGTFQATYQADTISGRFDAAWCATGVEP